MSSEPPPYVPGMPDPPQPATMTTLTLSTAGQHFIELRENRPLATVPGFVARVYSDLGVPAIAFGHRLRPGEAFPDGVLLPEGESLLLKDVAVFEAMLRPLVPADCAQCEWDALVSFMYNVENQPRSVEQLLAHGWSQVPTQLPRWCHKQGPDGELVEDPALKARRVAEAAMFKDGVYADA